MFDTIYVDSRVVRRHREGPLAQERADYLRDLAERGCAPKTLRRKAHFLFWLADRIQRRGAEKPLTERDLDSLSSAWARETPWSAKRFRSATKDWLRWLGIFAPSAKPPKDPLDDKLDDFIRTLRTEKDLSEATCANRRKQVRLLLAFLRKQGWKLSRTTPERVDAYLQHLGQRWSRGSLKAATCALRVWFRHCELRSWTPPGVATTILSPRIYRYEAIPLGPDWDDVRKMVASVGGDHPMQIRDRAILLLLAVYGLRSFEVRHLSLDDLDWKAGRIRVVRQKTKKVDMLPLDPVVGNALALYLREGRPRCRSRTLFLTMQAPFRELSLQRLYEIVRNRFTAIGSQREKGRGPQVLRHACAQRLLDTGNNFKQIGDHLGHRDPMTTRIYAKIDLESLRQVAMDDLGGLA